MKILIVTSSLDDGGVARIVSDMTLMLPKIWEFDILLVHDQDIRYPYRGNIIGLGIKEPKNRTDLIYAARVFVKRLGVLISLKRRNSYNACISFMDSCNVCNILSGNKHCKTIVAIANHMSMQAKYDWKYRFIVNPLVKLFYNRADAVVACSDESCNDLVTNYGIHRKILHRIYNSINTKSVEIIMETSSIPKEEKQWFSKDNTVVTAGRLCEQKGQWHLIRAFSDVIKRVPDAKLVVFGDGELKEYYEQLIRDYKLEASVYIHGFTKILPAYIYKSAVFVMPSIYEGLPLAMLIAGVCKTTCVASDFISGAREQLAPGFKGKIKGYYLGEFGIITPALDKRKLSAKEPLLKEEEYLANALVDVLLNKSLRDKYSDLAKRRSKDFDANRIYDEWKDLIIEVCENSL